MFVKMCENIVENSATVKKELLIPTQVACGSSSSYSNTVAMSLFDQLKNSVSHNLTVTDRTTNNKNGHKVKTLLNHHSNDSNQETQHSNNANKTQIYHGRSLLKPLNKRQQQQQEEDTNANYNDDDDEDEIKDDDNEEPPDIMQEKEEEEAEEEQVKIKNSLNYQNHNEHMVDDDEECNNSTASSISATTAPLQIALDSTSSSHSSNSSNNSFVKYCEKMIETTNITTAMETTLKSNKSIKLSNISDQKEKFEQQTSSTIACQTQPLSFMSNSSTNEISTTATTATSDVNSKTTITTTSLNSTASNLIVGNFFTTTDVGKTVKDGGEYIKKTAGEQQQQQPNQASSSLLLPQTTPATTTVSPLLGIVQGTKRATITPTAAAAAVTVQLQQQQNQQQQRNKKQNTRSVVSMNSLAHSATSLIDTMKATPIITTATTIIPNTIIPTAAGITKTRKSNKNLSNNDLNSIATQQQFSQQQHQTFKQMPIEQNSMHQVSKNTPTHFQRNQHKTTGTNVAATNNNSNNNCSIKRIQKSVLDFGRLGIHEKSITNNNNTHRIDNKRKRCNDRYDSSESSDR